MVARRSVSETSASTVLTLLSAFSSLFFSFLPFVLAFLSSLLNGVCRVVRAQLCEHARNTTRALLFLGLFTQWVCVVCYTIARYCRTHHTLFVVNGNNIPL